MPTSTKVKKILLSKALPIPLEGPIVELGSGWGTLAFSLAERYPQSKVIGFETSFVPYWASKFLLFFYSFPHLHLLRQDFFQADLRDAALVICYLYPEAMRKLKLKFEKELKAGTWVISHTFAIPEWTPLAIYPVKDLYQTKIYVYQFK